MFTGKSFVKFFPTSKLKIEFHSHKKVVSPKLENSAHVFIVSFKCAKFQENSRTFLREGGREVGREVGREGGRSLIINLASVYVT